MKLLIERLFIVLVLILINAKVYAGPNPPPPAIPPPGTPIDEGQYLLFIIAILFGLFKVYQFKSNKKTPI